MLSMHDKHIQLIVINHDGSADNSMILFVVMSYDKQVTISSLLRQESVRQLPQTNQRVVIV